MAWKREDISRLSKNSILKYINNVKKVGSEEVYNLLTHKYWIKGEERETLVKVGEMLWDYGYKPSKDWKPTKSDFLNIPQPEPDKKLDKKETKKAESKKTTKGGNKK